MGSPALRFHVVTIFPESFASFLATSFVGRAVRDGQLEVRFVDPRDFTHDRHRTTDDTPYGGGGGMVMKPEPVVAALEALEASEPVYRVLLTPQGRLLDQRILGELRERREVALVCGRYEGFDERVRSFVDLELSLGDFVLNGGEVAAMAIIEGVARLIPGVLGNAESIVAESHSEGLLEYPQYTRPREFRGQEVPEVLLNGDHEAIRRWRRTQMLVRTRARRPDLWQRVRPSAEDVALLGEHDSGPDRRSTLAARSYIALLHHPVYDRQHRVVATAITNLDLHDIARSSRTYGMAGYFVVTPLGSQRDLARRIAEHWRTGFGATYNHQRREALELLEVAAGIDEVVERVTQLQGQPPLVVATTAQERAGQVQPQVVKEAAAEAPLLFLLGTGWGLTEEVLEAADLILAPLRGPSYYNHLSVRSAAAILLDRFFGLRD